MTFRTGEIETKIGFLLLKTPLVFTKCEGYPLGVFACAVGSRYG